MKGGFPRDERIGGPLIGDAILEGCYALGLEEPSFYASIFAVRAR